MSRVERISVVTSESQKTCLGCEHRGAGGSGQVTQCCGTFCGLQEVVSACSLHLLQMTLVLRQLNLPRGCACSA